MNPTSRFSNRVEHYIRYRPTYPAAILDILRTETGLTPAATIADIGSGTGISSELFLRNGNSVLGVEPNPEMRAAAERLLAGFPKFHSVNATAEATSLPDAAVDYVAAGQAFHWFDPPQARKEFARILRPRGWMVLMWNTRLLDATPFLRAFESLLLKYGTDYEKVRHDRIGSDAVSAFFHPSPFTRRVVPNEQQFDWKGLKGRLLSSSYAPLEGDPQHASMLADLAQIYSDHAENGMVRFLYDTELYFGHLS